MQQTLPALTGMAVIAFHETIRVDVSFYDDVERQKLLRYPTTAVKERLAAKPIEPRQPHSSTISFTAGGWGHPDYQDYRAIGHKLHVAFAAIGDCLDFDGHSLSTRGKRTSVGGGYPMIVEEAAAVPLFYESHFAWRARQDQPAAKWTCYTSGRPTGHRTL